MTQLKKIWRFLSSMKLAVILLTVLAAACAGGSFITQKQSYEWYAAHYSEKAASAIKLFGLDDVFHNPWFIVIALFLCLNLLLCNVLRLPPLLRRYRDLGQPGKWTGTTGQVKGVFKKEETQKIREVFRSMGFHGIVKEEKDCLYAVRGRIGIWGAWICHLGILILIAGFGLGQAARVEYAVYGVPGQSKQIGDTDYILTIDDFRVDLREDDTVEQYTADLTVRKASSPESESASVSVNNPASMFGMKFYQNSTGYAAAVTVLKDGGEIQKEIVCAGDYLEVKDKPGLVILFSAFYPDYYQEEGAAPVSLSSQMNNPAYLYRAYYMDQVIGMNVLTGEDVITIDEYTVIFSDPQQYTLIQVKRDPYTYLALIGGLILLAGLVLAFYVQPGQLWAVPAQDGQVLVTGRSIKGGALFEEQLREALTHTGAGEYNAADGRSVIQSKEQINEVSDENER